MKKIKLTLAILSLLGISSCSDFLSEVPDDRTQLNSSEKISELLVNAYPNASYVSFAETMTDNVFETDKNITLKNTQSYNWEMNDETGIDTPSKYWDECYVAIAHANQALNEIKKSGNPASLNSQKGEALIARAYSHFMLVTFWAKAYNATTATTDLGIPYITEPEEALLKSYKRNTVAEVFNFLQQDIEEGLKLVTDKYKQPKFHFNIAASKAFASRFYLIKGDWKRVLELSSELGENPSNIRNYKAYATLTTSHKAYAQKYSDAEENTNLLIASVNSISARNYKYDRFVLSDERKKDIISPTTNLFQKDWVYSFYGSGEMTFIPKFDEFFKITNTITNIGIPYVALVLLSNDEFFLNRIEAHIMTNQLDLATQEMDYFLSTRTNGYNPATDQLTQDDIVTKYPEIKGEFSPFYQLTPLQSSYIKALAEIRRIDFIHEGLRWIDIKRFDLKVTHSFKNSPEIILQKNDKRKAIQLPLHVTNTGIEKNPR
jgi:hypothetical protein